jgi:2-hydroxy-6-oxonona-2,4-dienedioate hydrolase
MYGFSLILKILGLVIAVIAVVTYLSYQNDIRKARERIMSGNHVIETKCGSIEYATMGEGPPVLVVHGSGGGFDQVLFIARELAEDGFRIIAPSRFGYLRTPLPTNAAPAAQADAHACLLDALNINKVAIVAVSAGSLSSMQFALRYPDRIHALVLIVPVAWVPPSQSAWVPEETPSFISNVILKSDFALWLFIKIAPSSIITYGLGIPREVQQNLTPQQHKRLSEFMQSLLPISQRQAGISTDVANYISMNRYPLENITTPTLAISAHDDLFKTFVGAKYTADNIPGAKFIEFESGGHALIGDEEKVRSEVAQFIKQHEIPE